MNINYNAMMDRRREIYVKCFTLRGIQINSACKAYINQIIMALYNNYRGEFKSYYHDIIPTFYAEYILPDINDPDNITDILNNLYFQLGLS